MMLLMNFKESNQLSLLIILKLKRNIRLYTEESFLLLYFFLNKYFQSPLDSVLETCWIKKLRVKHAFKTINLAAVCLGRRWEEVNKKKSYKNKFFVKSSEKQIFYFDLTRHLILRNLKPALQHTQGTLISKDVDSSRNNSRGSDYNVQCFFKV